MKPGGNLYISANVYNNSDVCFSFLFLFFFTFPKTDIRAAVSLIVFALHVVSDENKYLYI